MGKLCAYCGVDPGGKGAVCALIPVEKRVIFVPTLAPPISINEWIGVLQRDYNLRVIMIESVHAIQGTSAKSNFMFGFNTGMITGIARTSGATVDLVTPKKWQKYIGVKTKGAAIKKEVASICERLYPHAEIHGPRGGLLDGRSDSLMIAHYASHIYNQST